MGNRPVSSLIMEWDDYEYDGSDDIVTLPEFEVTDTPIDDGGDDSGFGDPIGPDPFEFDSGFDEFDPFEGYGDDGGYSSNGDSMSVDAIIAALSQYSSGWQHLGNGIYKNSRGDTYNSNSGIYTNAMTTGTNSGSSRSGSTSGGSSGGSFGGGSTGSSSASNPLTSVLNGLNALAQSLGKITNSIKSPVTPPAAVNTTGANTSPSLMVGSGVGLLVLGVIGFAVYKARK